MGKATDQQIIEAYGIAKTCPAGGAMLGMTAGSFYERIRKLGIPALRHAALTIEDFENHYTVMPSGCWHWNGTPGVHGYGKKKFRGKHMAAHRAVWILLNGDIPVQKKRLEVCHTCDNRICVNPQHLFLGTRLDNARDCKRKGRNIHGNQSIHAKLSPEKVREIRRLYALGSEFGFSALGRKYGVSAASIYAVVTRKSWDHVE